MRKTVENLNAAGGAAGVRSTLVVIWNPVLDRRVEQGLPVGGLDRDFVGVGDPVHCHGLQRVLRFRLSASLMSFDAA